MGYKELPRHEYGVVSSASGSSILGISHKRKTQSLTVTQLTALTAIGDHRNVDFQQDYDSTPGMQGNCLKAHRATGAARILSDR